MCCHFQVVLSHWIAVYNRYFFSNHHFPSCTIKASTCTSLDLSWVSPRGIGFEDLAKLTQLAHREMGVGHLGETFRFNGRGPYPTNPITFWEWGWNLTSYSEVIGHPERFSGNMTGCLGLLQRGIGIIGTTVAIFFKYIFYTSDVHLCTVCQINLERILYFRICI